MPRFLTANGFPMPQAITSTRLSPQDFRDRSVVIESGCWEWAMSRQKNGYGQAWDAGRMRLAHRLSYVAHVGPIPEGLTVDHLCRNRTCVNPAHLRLLSLRENTSQNDPIGTEGRYAVRAVPPATRNAEKTHCHKGHEYTPENTYAHFRKGRPRRTCRQCVRASWAANRARRRAAAIALGEAA